EADRIRRANEIAALGLAAFRDAVAPGRTGLDLVAAVESAVMLRGTGHRGARRVRAFAQVATGAEETALGWRPMEISTRRPLADGDIALLELGVVADGYWADRTRVRAAGDPGARRRDALSRVLAAQEAAVAAVRPGAVAGDVDAAARSVLASAGLGREFLHITGHGTGFRYHEPGSFLSPGSATILEEGMVFSVEPGVYSPELGGMRLEDNILVTATGGEVLGPFAKDITG
ncbi:MAG TPA: M24 family metallopeptidase, partial [bacterium]|nr:M24 family metallopeptidase [bacterium]